MTIICPTVLAETPEEFKKQLAVAVRLAKRIQIDVADGVFTPNKTVNLAQVYFPDDLEVDIHLMYQKPEEETNSLISLKPQMVIVHAESDMDFDSFYDAMRGVGIKVGLAILPDTQPGVVSAMIEKADHLLIFGGKLGFFSDQADLTQLSKVEAVRAINPDIEIGWDGGANQGDVKDFVEAGIDVINVGSFIQKAESPDDAYAILGSLVSGSS